MNVLHYITEAMAEVLKLGLGFLFWLILLTCVWSFVGGKRRHLWNCYINDRYGQGPIITGWEKFILVIWMVARPDKIAAIHKNLAIGMAMRPSIYKVMYPKET